jgi:hypothetical protein
MLQFILTAALCAQTLGPPTDAQVLAALPKTDAVRTDVSVTKQTAQTSGATVWVCVAYCTETLDGAPTRRVHVVYLEPEGVRPRSP